MNAPINARTLKAENPKGRLLELCARRRLSPPEVIHEESGDSPAVALRLVTPDGELWSADAPRRTTVRRACAMHRSTVDLEGLLRVLCEREIAFVIVGGAAAVLHGAPTTTQDLDTAPEQSEANRIQCRLVNETIWPTQGLMAELSGDRADNQRAPQGHL